MTQNTDYTNPHVLLVEDDEDFGGALSSLLKKEGYKTTLATTSEEALELVKTENFDAIISDFKLPGMDGVEFLMKTKEIKEFLPVIMLTGYASLESAQKAVRFHAFDYLQKPLDNKDQLLRPLEKAIQNYRLKQANLSLTNQLQQKISELETSKNELVQRTSELENAYDGIKRLYTKLQKTNEELKELDRLKSEFVAAVSHELRTPLTVAKANLSLLEDEILGKVNKKQKDIILTSKKHINRLSRIIIDLLDISKIESGKITIEPRVINIVDIISSAAAQFQKTAKEKGIKLTTKFDKQNTEVFADEDKLMQIFSNLIENSIKFTEEGEVNISITDKNFEVECSVYDTGIGIPKKNFKKIFNKFETFANNDNYKDEKPGTGLGLSIVKGLVKLHNGNIKFDSKQGKWTRFTFTIPKFDMETLLQEKSEDSSVEKSQG